MTLESLVEQAMKRAADRVTSEVKKEQEEARAEAKMEQKFKAEQVEYLQHLLPNTIWNELGIDLTKLTFQYDTMFCQPGMADGEDSGRRMRSLRPRLRRMGRADHRTVLAPIHTLCPPFRCFRQQH